MTVRYKIVGLVLVLGLSVISCVQSTKLGAYNTSLEIDMAGSKIAMSGNKFLGEANQRDDPAWHARKGMLELQFDISLTKTSVKVLSYSLEIRGRNIGADEIGPENAWLVSGEDRVELEYQSGYRGKSNTTLLDGGGRAQPWMGASYIFVDSPKGLFAKDEDVDMEIMLADGTIQSIRLGEVQRKNVMQFLDEHDPTEE